MKLYSPAIDCTPQDVNNCSFKKAFLNKFEKTYMLTFAHPTVASRAFLSCDLTADFVEGTHKASGGFLTLANEKSSY